MRLAKQYVLVVALVSVAAIIAIIILLRSKQHYAETPVAAVAIEGDKVLEWTMEGNTLVWDCSDITAKVAKKLDGLWVFDEQKGLIRVPRTFSSVDVTYLGSNRVPILLSPREDGPESIILNEGSVTIREIPEFSNASIVGAIANSKLEVACILNNNQIQQSNGAQKSLVGGKFGEPFKFLASPSSDRFAIFRNGQTDIYDAHANLIHRSPFIKLSKYGCGFDKAANEFFVVSSEFEISYENGSRLVPEQIPESTGIGTVVAYLPQKHKLLIRGPFGAVYLISCSYVKK